MVSFGLLVGAVLAGVYNWASGVYSYNRDAWMTDIQVEQAHVYQEDNLLIQMQAMQREEVRDLVNSDINRINNSLLVATLILSLSGEMLFEGQIPTDCPAFVLNAYMLCLGSAVFHLSFCILFGISASSKAYRRASTLLTRSIRPQWRAHFNKMQQRKATENTASFESKPFSRIMLPPLASRLFRGSLKEDEESVGSPMQGTWSDATSVESPSRWRQRSEAREAKQSGWQDSRHVAAWKDEEQAWRKFSSCMFKCLARGTMNLLEACGYLAVGTLYGGYADAWAFWAIQILFTVINIMIVHFLLDSFEPINGNHWVMWLLRQHPLGVASLVASGPLFCVIAAATSWVIMDRFLIPLCYGTHTLVNVYFVSMFTSDEEVQEKYHDSDSERGGIESADRSWIPELWRRGRVEKSEFLGVAMLRHGTMVVNLLWVFAFLWALYGAWFGMDFKNSKAAVPTWGETPPNLEMSQQTMASPSPFWKPHALVCPRKQVFLADQYHVYELLHNNTQVHRYSCDVNGTIADVAATCNQKHCWPVVLLQGVPPMVLDCSSGRQYKLLQSRDGAGRIATNADSAQGILQTLFASMDGMIVQYGWNIHRGAWEPLWDIEEAAADVLAMDLVKDRLLVFYRGGFVQLKDVRTGVLCGSWALGSGDAVIGGGCGSQEGSSILLLMRQGHGTSLMQAKLPALKDCQPMTASQ